MGLTIFFERQIWSTDATKASTCGLLLKTKGFKVYRTQKHVEESSEDVYTDPCAGVFDQD